MKNFLRGVYVFIKGIGYARAAAFHARQGDHKRANQIMEEYGNASNSLDSDDR